MINSNTGNTPGSRRTSVPRPQLSLEHYRRLILHRWWIVLCAFALVSAATVVITARMPDVFTSYTLILVDPQKVPEAYVKATVTGDVRNRLGTLSQQILSATRLQKIIDALNLYPEEKKSLAREDVIAKMRKDINVSLVSDYGGSQDLQAFRITYSGRDPRVVAQVTNQVAALFIEENLKVREQQATGTSDFLENQLQETRKALEAQEGKLRDFKLKHIGELPEQQSADLQLLGQLQSQLQIESEALSRAEQQKSYFQSMLAQAAPVIELDEADQPSSRPVAGNGAGRSGGRTTESNQAKLSALLSRGYTEQHPEVRRLRAQLQQEESIGSGREEAAGTAPASADETSSDAKRVRRRGSPGGYTNPVLQSQLKGVDNEIAKHKEEQQRLRKLVSGYQGKLEAIPVREQQMAELVRDYEISKSHYSQLLEKQLSAKTATQLEVRQKGEKFSVLDPAQPAERPSSPNRTVLNAAGAIAGLVLGLCLALATELLGISITAPDQITATSGLPVLEVIPMIRTHADRVARRRRIALAAFSGAIALVLAICAVVIHEYRSQAF